MYLTDTHVPSIMRGNMRNYTDEGIVTILSGVTQERRGELRVEDYYQTLTDPQALQLDTRLEDLDLLYFSDYGTGYIYSVSKMIIRRQQEDAKDPNSLASPKNRLGV
ncbi:unnamed protein product [Ectocarpus sp. CCAP 1310/34]|nr:unnamed protein product [Ectocarpus sp. CCAP 1310/34]